MARRYQQGIGIPESLGAPLGEWKDPTPTSTSQIDFRLPNVGVKYSYGSTGEYLDTIPHRWTVSKSMLRRSRDEETTRGTRTRGTGRPTTTTGTPTTGTGFPPPTGGGRPPAGLPTGGTPAPPGLPPPTPASVRTGLPVPPPPPTGTAPSAPTGAPPLIMPPMPPRRADDAPWMTREPDVTTADDPFIVGVRSASDTPLDSPVDWRDDPDMDILGLPGGAGDRALEEWLRGGGADSSIVPPPASRSQRRPRTT